MIPGWERLRLSDGNLLEAGRGDSSEFQRMKGSGGADSGLGSDDAGHPSRTSLAGTVDRGSQDQVLCALPIVASIFSIDEKNVSIYCIDAS